MCKVRVPRAVLDGLEAVRQSGLTNMLDRPVVARLAAELGFAETADWVDSHRAEYAQGSSTGSRQRETTEMCGLAGAILGQKRRRRAELRAIGGIFTELLLLSQKRGTDAAGLAVVRNDGTYKLLKRPGPAANLIAGKLYPRLLDLDNRVTALLGHTRRKSRGTERNRLNNHPIRAGRVIGTHNGHIRNADRLARRLRLPRVADVDSEVLFRLVDRARSDREFRRLLFRCQGRMSAAFVRLDHPLQARLLKGDMPLSAAHVPRLRAVLYASEAWMLRAALDGLRYRLVELDPFTLSTFDVRDVLDFTQQDVSFRVSRCLTR